MAKVIAVCISEKRGLPKTEKPYIETQVNHGIIGDAHAGDWHRQISLLAIESINTMRDLGFDLKNGAFAENIITQGIILAKLPVGTLLQVGKTQLEITQIGKECHSDCAIIQATGKCIMPKEGVFAKVMVGGRIASGDAISILEKTDETD